MNFQDMGLCPIAPSKGFPNVYGARLAHRPLETFGRTSLDFIRFISFDSPYTRIVISFSYREAIA